MERFTTISRTKSGPLPEKLALLSAKVVHAKTDDRIGEVEGALVNGHGKVRFFVVRRERSLGPGPERVLVPLDGVEIGYELADAGGSAERQSEPVLRLRWTVEQLIAQPGFEEDGRLPHERAAEGASIVPPGTVGVDRQRAVRGGTLAGVVSAVAGGIAGMLAGGPLVGLSLALFFGMGGGIAGAISGGSRESAVEASLFDPGKPDQAGLWPVRELERALRDAAPFEQGLLRATPILPLAQGRPKAQEPPTAYAR